jgi:homopolymeric O-antigen transport system permease protein
MQRISLNPWVIARHLWSHRFLIWQFTRREVIGRYRGSYLGIVWSFVHPLLMLLVYTFVFGVIFKARWTGSPEEGQIAFAMNLFCGLIPYNLFAESLLRSPELILVNRNYVKKVVFPLEILPLTVLGASLIHALISTLILLLGVLVFFARLPWTVVYLPLVFVPLLFLALGAAWFLASLGVFLRDVQHLLGVVVQFLLFLSPIFYPVTALPERFRSWMLLNPLSAIVENFRRVLLWNTAPDWLWLGLSSLLMGMAAVAGYWWFQRTKKAFADVI